MPRHRQQLLPLACRCSTSWLTKENLNKRLAIVLDGHLYSAPVIRSEISEGKAQITGSFTEEEARELAAKINNAIGSQ